MEATEDHKWRHNMVLVRCMLDKQEYMQVCAYTRNRARTLAHTNK
jgi:hypothetical protein